MTEDALRNPGRDDISRNARSLARLADRLPAGRRYVVFLFKGVRTGAIWKVEVAEVGRSLELAEDG